MSFKQFLTVLCFTILAASLFAQVPNTINYQGRLTDASGSPVADGAYLVKFIIYDAPTAGTDLWNTGFQTINTVDGLFSYQLGSNVVLPNGIFSDTSRYLGLTVGTDAELSPRSRFISSAYAFEAGNVAWSNISSVPAGFADGVDDEGLSQAGDTLKGTIYFDGDNNGVADGGIQLSGASINLDLGDNGNTKSFIWGNTFGEIDLYNIDGDLTALLAAGNIGGTLRLRDNTGLDKIRMFGNYTGNSSVQLPTDAIDNNEILGEPGIARSLSSGWIPFDTSVQDMATITITIPAGGYIYLIGHCYTYHTGSINSTIASVQIDETAGGTLTFPYLVHFGPTIATNASFAIDYPVSVDRMYYKSSAGTYTFRIEGKKDNYNSNVQYNGVWLTAMYIPTSYGTVSTASSQPPAGTGAALVQSTNLDGSTEQFYKYDLRDLELKAKEAQLKAQQAEMELLKAQQRQSRNEQ